jgi:hypothetical protein
VNVTGVCVNNAPINTGTGSGAGFSADRYWSSSETFNGVRSLGSYQDFSFGAQGFERKSINRNFVRPIRAFSKNYDYQVGGTGPGGGIIYYQSIAGFNCGNNFTNTGSPSGKKCYFLEVAPSDWTDGGDPQLPWAIEDNWNSVVDGITDYQGNLNNRPGGTDIGRGYQYSLAIVAQGNDETTAAGAARTYSGGSKNDWYLPASGEVNLLCQWARGEPTATISDSVDCNVNSGVLNSGSGANAGLQNDSFYYSSSEYNDQEAWIHDMDNQILAGLNYAQRGKGVVEYVRPIRAF